MMLEIKEEMMEEADEDNGNRFGLNAAEDVAQDLIKEILKGE